MTKQEAENFKEELRSVLLEWQGKFKPKPTSVSVIDKGRTDYAEEVCRLIASDIIIDDGLFDIKTILNEHTDMITIRITGNNIKFKTGVVLCALLNTTSAITPHTDGTLDIDICIDEIKKEI